jgi:hypothetical protein
VPVGLIGQMPLLDRHALLQLNTSAFISAWSWFDSDTGLGWYFDLPLRNAYLEQREKGCWESF